VEENMIVSVVQFSTESVDDIGGRGIALVEQALKDKPELIVLQELFNTIYFPQYGEKRYFCHAEEIPGKTTDRIMKAIGGSNTVVVAPLFEKEGESYYCSAAIVDAKDGVVGVYRKLHIPSVPTLHETYFFRPGDRGHMVFDTRSGKLAVMLCYDRHFPESARLYGLQGADLLCVAAATPKGARNIWHAEMRAHAFSNAYILACSNRCGTEDELEFLGSSFICDHRGEVLGSAGEDEDAVVSVEVDLDAAREARLKSPFYRDRRPPEYEAVVRAVTWNA
jgi:N-carbamoylputrescine amidase